MPKQNTFKLDNGTIYVSKKQSKILLEAKRNDSIYKCYVTETNDWFFSRWAYKYGHVLIFLGN